MTLARGKKPLSRPAYSRGLFNGLSFKEFLPGKGIIGYNDLNIILDRIYSWFVMSVHLIIDGYNVIRQHPELSVLDALDLEAGRRVLLELLAAYRGQRPAHKITVVFDGWQGGELKESRDRRQGMVIIYSRLGEKADEVIKRLLAQERGRAVVVSSDGELRDFAQQVGAAWITAAEFSLQHLQGTGSTPETGDDYPPPGTRKKGPARRLPKTERRRQQRLKKL